ncbi:unnamed protein product [Ixodes pacificus]
MTSLMVCARIVVEDCRHRAFQQPHHALRQHCIAPMHKKKIDGMPEFNPSKHCDQEHKEQNAQTSRLHMTSLLRWLAGTNTLCTGTEHLASSSFSKDDKLTYHCSETKIAVMARSTQK